MQRSLLTAIFLSSVCLTMLGVFGAMWLLDVVKVCEHNVSIRILETTLFAVLTIYGFGEMKRLGKK